MGRDALPPRDLSKIVFEPSQQRRSFVIDPVASSAAGSSGEPEIVESTGPSSDGVSSRRWPWGVRRCPCRWRWFGSVPYHYRVGSRPCPAARPHPRRLGLPLGTSSQPTSGSTASAWSLPSEPTKDPRHSRSTPERRHPRRCGGTSPVPIPAHNAQTPSRAPRRKARATTAPCRFNRGQTQSKYPGGHVQLKEQRGYLAKHQGGL